jgi:subtilase-type serine protease
MSFVFTSTRTRASIVAVAAAVLAGCAGAGGSRGGGLESMPAVQQANAGVFTFAPGPPVLQTLDVPLSQFPKAVGTLLTGIRGNVITGFLANANGSNLGLVYDRNTGVWTPIKYPGSANTSVYGPALTSTGYRVVGSYQNSGQTGSYGFVYDSTKKKYQAIDAPANLCAPKSCNFTIVHSNYGDATYQAVGNYDAIKSGSNSGTSDTYPASGHAFIYDSASKKFSTLQFTGSASSTAYGIWVDGNSVAIAGGYTDKKGTHAYVRTLSGSKMLVYNWPKSILTHFEGITGAGGPGNYNVIGDYFDIKNKTLEYGFFLPIRKWTAGTAIVIGPVSANSVFQSTVIGVYVGAGLTNGYVTKIPRCTAPPGAC